MPSADLRIVMLGTGDFATPTFEHLLKTGHQVIGLITQPDRPQGRRQEIVPARIKEVALERGLRVDQPEDINAAQGVELVRCLKPDLLVTAAYGQILSAEVLTVPRLGGINLHGSILPAYRGAAPVARAIQSGETETGVTVIRMTPRVDAGGMMAFARTAIEADETAGEVEERLARMGAPLVVEAIAELARGEATILPQEKARVTRAPKLRKEDGVIDWTLPARAVHNLVRAMQPWPTASTAWHQEGKPPLRLIVHKTAEVSGEGPPGTVLAADGEKLVVAAGQAAVSLLEIQIAGKKRLAIKDFLRGYRIRAGDTLGG